MKARGRRPNAFIVFKCLKPRSNTKHEFLKLLLQQKKISLNYHLNYKFSQINYYIWDVKYAWTSKNRVWCAWSYHLIATGEKIKPRRSSKPFVHIQIHIYLSERSIGHFRVPLYLRFKTSLSAKLFIWKWVLHAVSFSCKSKSFS